MPVAAQATHRVHMEVMPLFAGYLPLPDVRLFKYLPHHSAHSSQLDAGKDFVRNGTDSLTHDRPSGQSVIAEDVSAVSDLPPSWLARLPFSMLRTVLSLQVGRIIQPAAL